MIQEKFKGDVHYVWCSESFDASLFPSYSALSHIDPSSNPKDIYQLLKNAVETNDLNCEKIANQKLTLMDLAYNWQQAGQITKQEMQDITYLIENVDFFEWRPLIYVIPRQLVESRLIDVPLPKRTGIGFEGIVEDLRRDEFHVIDMLKP